MSQRLDVKSSSPVRIFGKLYLRESSKSVSSMVFSKSLVNLCFVIFLTRSTRSSLRFLFFLRVLGVLSGSFSDLEKTMPCHPRSIPKPAHLFYNKGCCLQMNMANIKVKKCAQVWFLRSLLVPSGTVRLFSLLEGTAALP